MSQLPQIVLKPRRELSVKRNHPWVFSGAVQAMPSDLSEGTLIELRASNGEYLGVGFYGKGGIAAKVLTRGKRDLFEAIGEKIIYACQLRRNLGLIGNSETTGFRLINGEGDGLPGLVLDIYGNHAVLEVHSAGFFEIIGRVVEIVESTLSSFKLQTIYVKTAGGVERESFYARGATSSAVIIENGNHFEVEWEKGQKTGFFLDQRENRKLLQSLCLGKRVLNTFCFTGGFSVYTLHGGATNVVSVDSSAQALATLERNLTLNNFSGLHQTVQRDCFDYLENTHELFDVVVIDPPAFAKHLKAKDKALRGYERLATCALRHVTPGGMLFTFSCSQVVDPESFLLATQKGASNSGKNCQITHRLSQAPCHPITLAHTEGEYLKGYVMTVS